jgi:formate dehydrogenase maturation protein FdhE
MKPSLQLAKPVASICPACESRDVHCLTSVSKMAHVDYFRCQSCAHVWSLARPVSDAPCDYPERHHES